MKVLLTATVQSHICQFHKPLVEMLHENGCEVHVAAKYNLKEKNGLKLDFADKVFDVKFARSPKSCDNIIAYIQLKKIIDNEHYDIIHCNTPMGGIVTRLAARNARKFGTKIFYTAHGFHFYKGAPLKNWLIYYPIEKYFAEHFTDKLITIALEDYKTACKRFKCAVEHIHGVGVDENRYFPISIDEKIMLRQKMGYEKNQKLILCIGELLPNKNQQMAIKMMPKLLERYPNTILLLAGNGPEKVNLTKLINRLHIQSNVKLLGYVTNLEVYQRIADVTVSCSKREGLPLNIIESMLSGTPVVATNNRGHRELIEDGGSGQLIDSKDIDMMKEYIVKLLDDDKYRKTIIDNAEFRIQNYTSTHVKKELYNIYRLNEEHKSHF